MRYALAVDAGGTKTVAVVVDELGRVVGWGKAGCGCHEDVGYAAAQNETAKAVAGAMQQAGTRAADIAGACFGMAGADRDRDFARIRAFLEPVSPTRALSVKNDVDLILKAGSPSGVGIAVGCGTGTNCIARNRNGERVQVGGLGCELGDRAGGTYLGLAALQRAMRGSDGRGTPTMLYERICRELGLQSLEDIVDRFYKESRSKLNYSELAPLVFECAALRDEVATGLLAEMIQEIASTVRAARSRLFGPEERVTVVLGGGLFQTHQWDLARGVCDELAKDGHAFQVKSLTSEPVLGAVLYALEEAAVPVSPDTLAAGSQTLARWAQSPDR